ncbi:hypothetical protein [Rhizobium rhizogenes]|uniref:hypothetical protein n=1 Tax=Rhizobium rhizogenes TaxID=359 RepID=UPI00226F1DFF|nr:hypothetical protein [Rhizobium rhizogenes]
MQLSSYIAQVTGKTQEELFFLGTPLVIIEQDIDGKISITKWDDNLGVKQPSASDIATALKAPEPIVVPDSVSARQLKLQLLVENLLDEVDTWVAAQSRAIQIAYQSSGLFSRSEPMMVAGFAAMGFTQDQIDAFFIAAAKL